MAASNTNAGALVNALLANQSSFYWETHTWSHQFLGCSVWQPQALTSATANGTGGTFAAGAYSYEITAATAYGESEPSAARSVTVGANGSVALTWPEATNGTGTTGNAGPTLAQEEASHTGGTGFWGYNVYRENPGSTTYGLVGQVPENTAATSSTTYSFTDTGTAPGEAPDSGPLFPTATNPGIDCSSAAGSWLPATQHHRGLLHRAGDRPGPGLRQGERADQLHAGRGCHRRALGRREPEHAGRADRHRDHHDRFGRLPPAAAVHDRLGPDRAPLPQQHLLQRQQLRRIS